MRFFLISIMSFFQVDGKEVGVRHEVLYDTGRQTVKVLTDTGTAVAAEARWVAVKRNLSTSTCFVETNVGRIEVPCEPKQLNDKSLFTR